MLTLSATPASACTGITLKSVKNDYFAARTMEWGTFYFDSKLAVVPVGYTNRSSLGNGIAGLSWTVKHGFVGIAVADTSIITEGINERGLSIGVFYFPGYASYKEYSKSSSGNGLNVADVCSYLLSTCGTVAEVKKHIGSLNIVGVPMKEIGGVPPVHWRVYDNTGSCIVIEIVNKGQVVVYDAPLGVITNSPGYEWQLTNLRNYVNLRPAPASAVTVEGVLELAPFGVGSGFLGLPGDFTPPSRFVRAVAFTATVPKLPDAYSVMSQCFVILDNFNIPIGSVFPPNHAPNLPSSTQWTSVSDVTNLIFYYTTNYNRQIRQVNLKDIDFRKTPMRVIPLDKVLRQNIEVVSIK